MFQGDMGGLAGLIMLVIILGFVIGILRLIWALGSWLKGK